MCLLLYTADLPVCSPLCHAVLKTLQRWEQVLQKRLEIFGGAPSRYISTHLQDETALPGPALLKHKALFEPSNTPFRYSHKKSSIGLMCISFATCKLCPVRYEWTFSILSKPCTCVLQRESLTYTYTGLPFIFQTTWINLKILLLNWLLLIFTKKEAFLRHNRRSKMYWVIVPDFSLQLVTHVDFHIA